MSYERFLNMTPAPATPSRGRVLVVDDNPIIQRTMYFALRDKGYSVLMSGDLTEALAIVRKEKLDVILLDINFPPAGTVNGAGGRDGFWALSWMKRMDEVKDIPIIIISGDDPASASPRARAAGAAAYLHKPINKEEMALIIAELMAERKAGLLPPTI